MSLGPCVLEPGESYGAQLRFPFEGRKAWGRTPTPVLSISRLLCHRHSFKLFKTDEQIAPISISSPALPCPARHFLASGLDCPGPVVPMCPVLSLTALSRNCLRASAEGSHELGKEGDLYCGIHGSSTEARTVGWEAG